MNLLDFRNTFFSKFMESILFLLPFLFFTYPAQALEVRRVKMTSEWVKDTPPSLEISKILKDPLAQKAMRKAWSLSKHDETTQIKLRDMKQKVPMNFFHIAGIQAVKNNRKKRRDLRVEAINYYKNTYGGKAPQSLKDIFKPNFRPTKNFGKYYLVNKDQVDEENSTVGPREVAGHILHERKKIPGAKKDRYKYRTIVYLYIPKANFWNLVEAQTSGKRDLPQKAKSNPNIRIAASFHTHPFLSGKYQKKNSEISPKELSQRVQKTKSILPIDEKVVDSLIQVVKKGSDDGGKKKKKKYKDPDEDWKPSSKDKRTKAAPGAPPGIIVSLKKSKYNLHTYGRDLNPNPTWKTLEVFIQPEDKCIPAGKRVRIAAAAARPEVKWTVKSGPGKIVNQFSREDDHLINPIAYYQAPEKAAGKKVTLMAEGNPPSGGTNKGERTYVLSGLEITPPTTFLYPKEKETYRLEKVKVPVKWTVEGKAKVLEKKPGGKEQTPQITIRAPERGSFTIQAELKKKSKKYECNQDRLEVEVGNWRWSVSGPHHVGSYVGKEGGATDLLGSTSRVLKMARGLVDKEKAKKAEKKMKGKAFWYFNLGGQRAFGEGISRGMVQRLMGAQGKADLPLHRLRKGMADTIPGNALFYHPSKGLVHKNSDDFIGRLYTRNFAVFHNDQSWSFNLNIEKITEDEVRGSFQGWGYCSHHYTKHIEELRHRWETAEDNQNHSRAEKIKKHMRRDQKGRPRCGKIGLRLKGKFRLKNKSLQKDSSLSKIMPGSKSGMKEMAKKIKEKMGEKGQKSQEKQKEQKQKKEKKKPDQAGEDRKNDPFPNQKPGQTSGPPQKKKPSDSQGTSGKKPGLQLEVVHKDLPTPAAITTYQDTIVISLCDVRNRKFWLKKLTRQGKLKTVFQKSMIFPMGALATDQSRFLLGFKRKIYEIQPGGSFSVLHKVKLSAISRLYKRGGEIYVAGMASLHKINSQRKSATMYGRREFLKYGRVAFFFQKENGLYFYSQKKGGEYLIGKNGPQKKGSLEMEVVHGVQGRKALYVLNEKGEIWMVNPKSGKKKKITDKINEPAKLAWVNGTLYILERDEGRLLKLTMK